MIPEVDEDLEQWVLSVLKGARVGFSATPPTDDQTSTVNLYLLEVQALPHTRPVRDEPPLRIGLQYLVTAWATEAREMHRMLGELIFAAMENPAWEVERAAPPPGVWQSLGMPARPGFLLKAYATKERPAKPVQMVREQLAIRNVTMRPLLGFVRGPERNHAPTPIMGATIEIPSLQLSTMTNYQGRFKFAAIPADPPIGKLTVNVKGKLIEFPSPKLPAPEDPFMVDLPEDFFEPSRKTVETT